MNLATTRLILKEIQVTDLEQVHQLHLSPEVDRYNTLGIPASIDVTKALLAGWLEQQKAEPRMYIFCLRLVETDEFLGLMGLKIGKPNYKNAEIWYKILPTYWSKGYATEALKELLRFCFMDLCLHRIEAGCAIENIASIKVLEKVGMIREGSKRKILPIRGQWVDNYVYSILETEFLANT